MKRRVVALLSPFLVCAGVAAVTLAQTAPYPFTLRMTGPPTAVSGQLVSYRVHYHLNEPAILRASFRFDAPLNTACVSSRVVSGPPGVLAAETRTTVVWGAWATPTTPTERSS